MANELQRQLCGENKTYGIYITKSNDRNNNNFIGDGGGGIVIDGGSDGDTGDALTSYENENDTLTTLGIEWPLKSDDDRMRLH